MSVRADRTGTWTGRLVSDQLGGQAEPGDAWLDVFPWLQATSAGQRTRPWWSESIGDTGADERRVRLNRVTEAALERLSAWSVGQVFPRLGDVLLSDLPMPTRALNALRRYGCRTFGDLAGVELRDVLSWQQVGAGTVFSILYGLAEASIESPDDVPDEPGWTADVPPEPEVPSVELQPTLLAPVLGDLKAIAVWFATVGRPKEEMFGSNRESILPESVAAAFSRIDSLRAEDLLESSAVSQDIAVLLDEALGTLAQNATEILARRLLSDSPLTLEQLGQGFGVTRERVRQIEAKGRAALLDRLTADTALGESARCVAAVIGTVRPLGALLEQMPALARDVESVNRPAWLVLDRLDDSYEISDGWCAVPTIAEAQLRTRTQLEERADDYGVACRLPA